MPQLKTFQQAGGDQYTRCDDFRGAVGEKYKEHKAPENFIEHAAKRVVNPSRCRPETTTFSVEADWHNESVAKPQSRVAF